MPRKRKTEAAAKPKKPSLAERRAAELAREKERIDFGGEQPLVVFDAMPTADTTVRAMIWLSVVFR